MKSSELVIITPEDDKCKFHEGEKTTLFYFLKNVSDFSMRNIQFTIKSIKPDGEPTKKAYVTVGDLPKVILGGDAAKVDVVVDIPLDYNEFIIKDGEKSLVPFKLHAFVEAEKYVGWS